MRQPGESRKPSLNRKQQSHPRCAAQPEKEQWNDGRQFPALTGVRKKLACPLRREAADRQFRLLQAFKRVADGLRSLRQALLAADDHKHRGARAAQSHSQNAVLSRQRQQGRQQAGRWARGRAGECGPSWQRAAGRPAPGQRPAPAGPRTGCWRPRRRGSNWRAARRGPCWWTRARREERRWPATRLEEQRGPHALSCLRRRRSTNPPSQQAAALSGWPSSAQASSRMRSELQPSRPKCTARAMAASRPAADEPQPIPSGMPFAMRIARGTTGRPLLLQQAPYKSPG